MSVAGSNFYFYSVSCPNVSFCAAVTSNGALLTYNGSSWSKEGVDPSSQTFSVSCPSATFCMAVDLNGNALTYNGSSWSPPREIDGSNFLYSVSCSSATFCMAVDSAGNALTYNGSSWSAPSHMDGSKALNSVWCPSATFCMAVDSAGNALTYNGSSWSAPSNIDSNLLISVSCPSATFCAAVDGAGYALTYNGSSWSAPSTIDGSRSLGSVSCPSSTFCTAVDLSGNALTYNGSSWSAPLDIDGSRPLPSVSCPSATFCIAVDSAGNALTYSTNPPPPPPPTPRILLPSAGATLSGSTFFDASESNATSVEFLLFGGPYGFDAHSCVATSTPYGWICAWDTTVYPNDSYILVAEAFNSAGTTFSSGVSITIGNPPTARTLTPSNGATLSGSTYPDAAASIATSSVEFRLFGGMYGYSGLVICTAVSTVYGWLCPWNTTTVPDGSYVLLSEGFNSYGSVFSSGVSITVDN
jgi:hypothetical protein